MGTQCDYDIKPTLFRLLCKILPYTGKIPIFPSMSDSLNEDQKKAEERKARIKKMRGWLSPRDTVADDFGPEDAALYYGEGHSGWNR